MKATMVLPQKTPQPQVTPQALPEADQNQTIESWGHHFRATIALALPLIVGQIAMISIWTADIVMLGWIDAESLAAGVQANRLYQPFYFIALGLTLAISPLTAQALGGGKPEQARQILRQGLGLSLICGTITFGLMAYGEAFLILLGQGETLARRAAPFLYTLGPGMIPIYLYFTLRNYISAHKKPLPPVVVTVAGAVINIALNAILSKGLWGLPALGLAGIGLATSVTFLLMALALIAYMLMAEPFRASKPFAEWWQMDFALMRRLLIIGVPIAVMLLCETGLFIFTGLYMGVFGTNAVAASGIANQIAAVFFMVPLAIGQAATIRVGHEAGARRRGDTLKSGIAPVIITVLAGLVQSAAVLVFAEGFIRAFLNPDDAALESVVALALPMVVVVAFFQVIDGVQIVCSSVLRGLNDTKIPAVLAIFSYWGIGASSAVLLSFSAGPIGVWWGIWLGLAVGSITLGWRSLWAWRRIQKGGALLLA